MARQVAEGVVSGVDVADTMLSDLIMVTSTLQASVMLNCISLALGTVTIALLAGAVIIEGLLPFVTPKSTSLARAVVTGRHLGRQTISVVGCMH